MGLDDLNIEQLEKASNMLKAMAHPVRIAILKLLSNHKGLSVKEIQVYLKIEQATTSHHLGILKDKNLLISKRKGKNTIYSLKHDAVSNILNCLGKCVNCNTD